MSDGNGRATALAATLSVFGKDGAVKDAVVVLKNPKLEGDKLTGALSGRNAETPSANAALKGDEISFEVTREFNGNKMTSTYKGKLSGDSIKGKIESTRDGQAQSRDWDAKREAAKPKEDAKPKDGAAK